MMSVLQKIYLVTLPIATVLTTVAMLLPYWWTSETTQVGLWRARTFTSAWIKVEPQLDTFEGRLLFILQILSFLAVLFTDLSALIWLFVLIYRSYQKSLLTLISLFALIILIYFCLSLMIFFVWYSKEMHLDSYYVSYSFYLTLILLLCHTMTLISLTMNFAQYRLDHRCIRPSQQHDKLTFAFNDATV